MVNTFKTQQLKTNCKKNSFEYIRSHWPLYTMFIPGFVLVLLFNYLPMFGIIIAFKKINLRDGISSSPWVGLDNFEMMLRNSNSWISIKNTVLYNGAFILSGLIFSVALAILLSLLKNKLASKTYQTIYIMPHFLSMVIVSYLVLAFLNMESGYMNNVLLPFFGVDSVENLNWYANASAWPIILFIVRTWKETGYGAIVYLAAISGIDTQMYEAAKIDGASLWKQIIYITLPSIKNIMIIMTILNIGKIFSADFGLFYNVTMNSGALYPTTLVINTYVYNMMTAAGSASTGLASAAAMLQSVFGFVLVLITNAIVKKIDSDSALF